MFRLLTRETQSPMTNFPTYYYLGGKLILPHPIRTYFDSGAQEWSAIEPKQKLLDIGYVTTLGYDVFKDIQEILKNHPYIQEFEIKYSIGLLMSELSGRSSDAISDRYENVPLKAMVNDLIYLLAYQYVLPHDGSEHYLIDKNTRTTDLDILKANQWNTVADQCHENEALFSDNHEYIYPGDEKIIHKFNSLANDDTRFIVNTIPYPFQGNPLTAKVVILSLNAGYVPRINCYFAKILQHYPQLAEGVMCFMRDNLRLNVKGFMPNVLYSSEKRPNYQDAYNMLGDWYWYDILSKWQNEGLSFNDIFSNVALIQSIPYASEKAKDLPKGCVLPSQIFIKKMIIHIANSKETLFVVPRAVKKWQNLLGATWDKLERENRVILGKNPLNQSLSRNNLGDEPYNRIISQLKNSQ